MIVADTSAIVAMVPCIPNQIRFGVQCNAAHQYRTPAGHACLEQSIPGNAITSLAAPATDVLGDCAL
jgi:hypothetical protein